MKPNCWWMVLGSVLTIGGFVIGAVMDWPERQFEPVSQQPALLDVHTRQPMPEGLAHLQFVADAVRCPVSSRSAVMASCIVERYHKMRNKALLWRAKYERLEGLERAYWAALAREGLTQRVEHVPTGKVAP